MGNDLLLNKLPIIIIIIIIIKMKNKNLLKILEFHQSLGF